jgi:hypothetical protein
VAKKSPTKAERDHLARVAALGCIACLNLGYTGTPAEIHHITKGAGMGQKASHFETIPLCFHHHSAQGQDGFHKYPETWQLKHGRELDLLEQVRGML